MGQRRGMQPVLSAPGTEIRREWGMQAVLEIEQQLFLFSRSTMALESV